MTALAARRNGRTAMIMAVIVAAMLGLAFASVPLYRIFCQLTGFDGTPLRAEAAPGAVAGQIGVRFDANVHPGLPWRFEPKQATVRIAPGARTQIFYHAQNLSARPITGQAVFNVSPDQAGKYFKKIECFCFTEQTLKAGESVDMPVIFFVDPAILRDPDTKRIDEITLSYTFYPVESAASGR
ncbi:MAG TPA: cytochrome c oxidase assembly protein [Dongiaceae bacterium]|nr:cytochrome c oxidase assembly protein [Dongiaceae bacterium]